MRFFFNRHYHFSKSPFSQLPHDTKIINSPICSEKEFHVINAISMKFHICKERGNFFDIFVIRVFTKIGCFMDKWRLDMHIGLILIGWAPIGLKLKVINLIPTFNFLFCYLRSIFLVFTFSLGTIFILTVFLS